MGVINCLKELIKGNKDYTDLNPNLKPNIKISSPIFETINQNRIDVRKAKSRIYYDILVTLKFEQPVALSR